MNMTAATKVALLAAALLGSSMLATDADAHGRYRHRSHVGIYVGVPGPFYYRPYSYYPRYYYPPAVVVPAPAPAYYPPTYYPPSPSTYIEQSAPAAPAASAGTWYYCRDTQAYYPYVKQCATPWEPVAPHSGPPS